MIIDSVFTVTTNAAITAAQMVHLIADFLCRKSTLSRALSVTAENCHIRHVIHSHLMVMKMIKNDENEGQFGRM